MNKLGIFLNFWEQNWEADHIRYINKAADLGFDILEFQVDPLLLKSNDECNIIKCAAIDRGIELTYSMGLDPKYDLTSSDPRVRKEGTAFLKKVVSRVGFMEGKIFSGVNYAGWGGASRIVDDKPEMLNRSVECMKEIVKIAEDWGVMYCVEAVNRFETVLINTAREAIEYIQLVDSKNMGVHLDTYHMNIEEPSIGDAIRLAGDNLKHFHTGENNRTAPGRGHLDWKEISRALKDIGYRGRIVSEPFVKMGGEVGRDIRVWRDLIDDVTEQKLDQEAIYLLNFTKEMLS